MALRLFRDARSARDSSRVLWLAQALDEEEPRPCPPLSGDRHVDVCIVGGGYTGLWTALELRDRAPDLSVLIVEASQCGFGASGRNGGWAVGWYDKIDLLIEAFGEKEGLWLAERARCAVLDLEERVGELGIRCGYRRAGAIYAASAASQARAWERAAQVARRQGRAARFEALEPGEAARRSGVRLLGAGANHTDTATLHPGRLVRGLRAAALRAGVEVAEHSEVLAIERSKPVRLRTVAGSVICEHAVLATGAWTSRTRELRRAVLPFGSHMVASAPIAGRVEALGWTDGVGVSDLAELVHYAQVTEDGRVAFGRGGGAIGSGGRVSDRHFHDRRWAAIVARDFRAWFPALADVPLTHAWGGPIDHTPGHFPFVGSLGDHANLHYGVGYSGDGVAQATFVASILAARILGEASEDARCALGRGPYAFLPPEPFRSLGGRLVREAVLAAETREGEGRGVPGVIGGVRRFSRFQNPPWLESLLRLRDRLPGRDPETVARHSQ